MTALAQIDKKASDPTKNSGRVPPEHIAHINTYAAQLSLDVTQSSDQQLNEDEDAVYDTEDADVPGSFISARGKDKETQKIVWRSLYLGIREARGQPTAALYLQLISDPLAWGTYVPFHPTVHRFSSHVGNHRKARNPRALLLRNEHYISLQTPPMGLRLVRLRFTA